jgi:hypothetical protein
LSLPPKVATQFLDAMQADPGDFGDVVGALRAGSVRSLALQEFLGFELSPISWTV